MIRAYILGALGSALVTMSSMYVALRLGALPWPTVFAALLSLSLLKMLKNTNTAEIAVAHTGMSTGGLIAGAVAFTLPAVWILSPQAELNFWVLLGVTLAGTVLGVVFSYVLRPYFIEKQKLPFPMGQAAANTVLAGLQKNTDAVKLFAATGFSGIFTACRDVFALIPATISNTFLASKNIFFGLYLSPMAIGIGYLIGPVFMGTWFLGALCATFGIIPLGIKFGFFNDISSANDFKNSLGIGILIGGGISIPVKMLFAGAVSAFKAFIKNKRNGQNSINIVNYKKITHPLAKIAVKRIGFAAAIAVFIMTFMIHIPIVASIVCIISVWLVTIMAASLTGQTGIDPMEIFGIIVLLTVRLAVNTGIENLIYIAGIAAIAAAVAGDSLQDYKSGEILKANPFSQFISESIGGIVGAFVSVIAFYVMKTAYGTFGPQSELLAPQAYAVALMSSGIPHLSAFYGGMGAGFVSSLFGIPAMTFGIGLYLPMVISAAAAIGAAIKLLVQYTKKAKDNDFVLYASGFLGGEGIAGMLIAIIKVVLQK